MERHDLRGVPGVRFTPPNPTGTGVLVVAGSSGRIDAERARIFAQQGAIAESLQWFGGPGQHDGPWEVALEIFIERVEALSTDCERVVMMGTSFGSEAALLTAAHCDKVDAVVAFAPSDVAWTGVTHEGRMTSHWTVHGHPVPHIPFVDEWEPDTDPPAFVGFYQACRDTYPQEAHEAAIAVERIPEVVLVAGGDDQVWPSLAHARLIAARREQHGLPTVLLTDDEAGHRTILPGEHALADGIRMARGGTESADRRLGEAAWPHLIALL